MNNFNLTPIEHCGQRVLTTAQLTEAYETDIQRLKFCSEKAGITKAEIIR